MKKTYNEYQEQSYSFSFLRNFAQSPAHARAYMDQELKSTPAMELGSAFHALMEGDKKFYDDYFIIDANERPNTSSSMAAKINKDWKAELIEAANYKDILSGDDWRTIIEMRNAVDRHPAASKLLFDKGHNEIKLTRKDLTGRLDKLVDGKYIIDWKSTVKINPEWMEKDIVKYFYHAQASMYNYLADGDLPVFLVFVEKTAPFDVLPVLIPPGSDIMEAGRELIINWTNQADECFRLNKWPGLSDRFDNNFLELY